MNRVLAEGRSRFRDLVSRSEDGTRCRELRPLLSAFCDGEAAAGDAETVREHLRACAHCRATLRAYRAAPRLAGLLAPPLLSSRSLLGRLRDLLGGATSRISGTVKLTTACAAGTAACMATGVLPAPFVEREPSVTPAVERTVEPSHARAEQNVPPRSRRARKDRGRRDAERHIEHEATPEPVSAPIESEASEPVEYEAAATVEAPSSTASAKSSGSAAGEFGP